MLVVNKVVIHYVPAPSTVLALQLGASAGLVYSGGLLGFIQVDGLEWGKVRAFSLVVAGFLGTLFANMKVLQYANVETFITFRSSTPLLLSLCDFVWLGRALPSARSWGCLVVLLGGAVGYVAVDADFRLSAYTWLALWYGFFTFDTVYAKHVVDTVRMTNWGRVFYGNFMALPPLLLLLPALGEHTTLAAVAWEPHKVAVLVLSCLLGLGMSHASYLLREAVSATLFTIIGILCKVLTVIINVFIWDKHASPGGIACLMVCVLAGTFYQQAPKRPVVLLDYHSASSAAAAAVHCSGKPGAGSSSSSGGGGGGGSSSGGDPKAAAMSA
ncbi:hypothetical protein HYH02_004229 [Chlamydomonas schloesseri]|uniref:Sugar phosphate transporter domain-containing protein n=1 Tax=Chlamydomonas schloesseri TaxID=2026947 RepID=A0A835WNJ2_9CHLO|nr:hypothetical protein HYH02_004229 [Chlamydomonas schloesseri]|eukprot:KAG2450957.1 hypothetical protein HYH02_004229 [Chlamydomonas schloesseri]